ncbi:MAG: oleate hydratase [Bacteroidota bacterium]|nr:oleate hydratase [Bacteroidota bacterium]
MDKSISIIGSGFSSLSAACYLAKQGYNVSVYEKNNDFGGRARQLKENGFTFDIGPSFYWMPDIFDRFFNDFNKKTSDYYELTKLNPAYSVYFDENNSIPIEDSLEKICNRFEKIETGSSIKLKKFILNARENYRVAVLDLIYKMPGESPLELVTIDTIKKVKYFLTNIRREVRKDFKNHMLRAILEFPVLFLGAKPSDTPAFYNFMNYADFGLGTFQPKNGFYDVVQAMIKLGESLGVSFYNNSNVTKVITEKNKVIGLEINEKIIKSDIVVSGADYNFTEKLLPKNLRQYSDKYWDKRTLAPSALLFYIGFNKKLNNIEHHNLIFDTDFDQHAVEIYDDPKWPTNPLLYASFTSKTHKHTAPEGCENGVFLIPIAPNLDDNKETRKKYLDILIKKLEKVTKQNLKSNIIYLKSYCVNDFVDDYNSYKGNAYGLANTLLQTAFLRPKLRSKKVSNLYFCGQLTVPGPGVPPALVSGKLVSDLILKYENN